MGTYLFEALFWSDFIEEREYLFIGGLQVFQFLAVHDVPRAKNYGPFIAPMEMMQRMIDGFPYQYGKITASNVDALQLLIENRHKGITTCPKTGMYVNKLFRNLVSNVRRVEINMYWFEDGGQWEKNHNMFKVGKSWWSRRPSDQRH